MAKEYLTPVYVDVFRVGKYPPFEITVLRALNIKAPDDVLWVEAKPGSDTFLLFEVEDSEYTYVTDLAVLPHAAEAVRLAYYEEPTTIVKGDHE